MNILKFKGGALQFTMYIVVVVALLLGGFIILVKTHQKFKAQTQLSVETVTNAAMGMQYALEMPHLGEDTIALDVFDEAYKTLKLQQHHWGVFEKHTVVSTIKSKKIIKMALVGGAQATVNRTALYVVDRNRPLVLVGDAKIQGTAFLPKQGVRTGTISGHSYYGKQLIYGRSKNSTDKMPKLSKALEQELDAIYKADRNTETAFINLSQKTVLRNSFSNTVKVIYSAGALRLDHVALTGHIIVRSQTKITVAATAQLTDVILVAPLIEFESNFKGVLQAFASKTITVGQGCQLRYPSALVLHNTEKASSSFTANEDTPAIVIGKRSILKGLVLYSSEVVNYKAQVILKEGTEVVGEVYCTKNLELLGKVSGAVYTSGFVANQSGSVYQNHIYNGVVQVNDLETVYAGLLFENNAKSVAKWLY